MGWGSECGSAATWPGRGRDAAQEEFLMQDISLMLGVRWKVSTAALGPCGTQG